MYLLENCVEPLLGGSPDPAVLDAQAAQFHKLAGILDARLAGRKWIATENPTIAGIALAAPMHLWPAVLLVHSDYTVASGPQRVRDLLPAEAEGLLQQRVAFYNVWKPLYRRVEEPPLAMCDATTHDPEDMLRMDIKYRERKGEIYVMRHSPWHRWRYFPLMEAARALRLKTYDSVTDGRARFMGHTAFQDPTTPPNAPKHESIEVQKMAFF